MKPKFLLAFLLILLLSACGPSAEQQATMTATSLTATAAVWTPTAKPTATATVTPTPKPTATPTKTSTSTNTPDPNRYFAPDNSYSLIPPEGWQPEGVGLEFPALVGPEVGNFDLKLVFSQDKSSFSVFMWAALVQDSLQRQLQNLSQIGEDFPTTDEGMEYFRWEFTHTL